jgi:hypothetical protein
MNRPIPHIGQTIGQRQAMRYTEVDKAALLERLHSNNAVLATEQAHDEARQLAEAAFQPIPAQFVDDSDDGVTTEPEPVDALALYAIDVVVAIAALALMAAFGAFGRDPVHHLLVWMGVMS